MCASVGVGEWAYVCVSVCRFGSVCTDTVNRIVCAKSCVQLLWEGINLIHYALFMISLGVC